MKKQISPIFILLLFLISCSVERYSIWTNNYDLSKYLDQGILITNGDLNIGYQPISIIEVYGYSGYIQKKQNPTIETFKDDLYSESSNRNSSNLTIYSGSLIYKVCNVQDLLDSVALYARNKGANGIINLKIVPVHEVGPFKSIRSGYSISGQIVKIIYD